MRIHLILEATRDEAFGRATFGVVAEALEGEVERLSLEADGAVYDLHVIGVGRSAREAEESRRLRAKRSGHE